MDCPNESARAVNKIPTDNFVRDMVDTIDLYKLQSVYDSDYII